MHLLFFPAFVNLCVRRVAGACEVTRPTKRKCLACWFRRCEAFYPAAADMKQSSPDKARKPLDPTMTPLALDLSDHGEY